MCTEEYRLYSRGCKKVLDFHQCAARLHSFVRCNSVERVEVPKCDHYCKQHCVQPGTDMNFRKEMPEDGVPKADARKDGGHEESSG